MPATSHLLRDAGMWTAAEIVSRGMRLKIFTRVRSRGCSNDVWMFSNQQPTTGNVCSCSFRLVSCRNARKSHDGWCRQATPQSLSHYIHAQMTWHRWRCTPLCRQHTSRKCLGGCKSPADLPTAVTRIQLEEAKSVRLSPPRPSPCGKCFHRGLARKPSRGLPACGECFHRSKLGAHAGSTG